MAAFLQIALGVYIVPSFVQLIVRGTDVQAEYKVGKMYLENRLPELKFLLSHL